MLVTIAYVDRNFTGFEATLETNYEPSRMDLSNFQEILMSQLRSFRVAWGGGGWYFTSNF